MELKHFYSQIENSSIHRLQQAYAGQQGVAFDGMVDLPMIGICLQVTVRYHPKSLTWPHYRCSLVPCDLAANDVQNRVLKRRLAYNDSNQNSLAVCKGCAPCSRWKI
jgi:hypothetical protein